MARNKDNDLFGSLRAQGLRKRVARALSDIENGGRGARGNAEKLAQRVIADLRQAADTIEQRLDLGGAGTRSAGAKKAATTRKRAAAKRSASAKKAAPTRAGKTTARKTTPRKTTARKASARKTTARKTSARTTSSRKSSS
jgi:DNA-binding protein HU-beta